MILSRYKGQYKQTMKLATPVILSQIGLMVVQLFDNAMVGRLGALPLAAVSFGGTVFFMPFIFVLGMSMAITPLVGEQYAQGKIHVVSAYFQNSLLLFTLVGIFTFIFQYAAIPLLYNLGQPIEVVDMAIPYYRYLVWSIIPFMIFCAFRQFLEGIGNTTINMVIIVLTNVINILLNWLLIYGNWGFPRLEAAGAGLATLISRICMPIFSILFFIFAPKFKAYFLDFKRENFSLERVRALLSVGFPIALQMFMEGAAFALTSIMMGWIGTVSIAANQIALTISGFAFMVVVGLGAATTIRISHEYGRESFLELKKVAVASYHLTLVWNFFTASVFVLFRKQIAEIFTSDPDVIQVASHLMLFVAAFQFSDGLQSISVGILRGIQDVKKVMRIAFFSYIVINLPVAYFCAFVLDFGASGLWLGFIFGLSIAATLLIIRFRKQWNKLYGEYQKE